LFIVLGINHNTAPVEVRERVAFEPKSLVPALLDAQEKLGHQGVAILSTCNRTELYLETDESPTRALEWMAKWHGLDPEKLGPVNYVMTDSEAASHLMKVACGLDSLILGEPQILGQLKSAYAVALDAGTLSAGLHRTFQQVFSTAKRIRSETAIGRNPVSVAYAAVSLARQIFSELGSKTALLIGAGETIRLASQHLIQQGVTRVIIANRTLNNAQRLAEELNIDAEAILLSDIPEYLHRADIVISSTASQLPILGKGAVESALKQRKHAMMFMVDIAVPRDIEHEVDELDDVYLFTVDDLSEVIEENRRSREEAAVEATTIIEECCQQWVRDNRAACKVDLIKVFRNRSTEIRDQELQKALTALECGESANKVLERLANNLTNKLIHHPTTELNRAISDEQNEIIDAAQRLFNLGDEPQD